MWCIAHQRAQTKDRPTFQCLSMLCSTDGPFLTSSPANFVVIFLARSINPRVSSPKKQMMPEGSTNSEARTSGEYKTEKTRLVLHSEVCIGCTGTQLIEHMTLGRPASSDVTQQIAKKNGVHSCEQFFREILTVRIDAEMWRL